MNYIFKKSCSRKTAQSENVREVYNLTAFKIVFLA